MTSLSLDTIEINTLGPGFGECIIVHIGNNEWVIVDSCIDIEDSNVAALKFFEQRGVPLDQVKLIVISHWHGDHISGISRVVESCQKADVCMSNVFDREQFRREVLLHTSSKEPKTIGSALREARSLLEIRMKSKGRRFIGAAPDRRILYRASSEMSHGRSVEVWTLSPSDRQIEEFLNQVYLLASPDGVERGRARVPSPNETSVVTWIQIGEIALLLAADLEEKGALQGWSSVVSSTSRPQGVAQVFKVPHHGSDNAHHHPVWEKMLDVNPLCVMTPWSLGGNYLPKDTDIARIKNYTPTVFLTSVSGLVAPKRRPAAVERTLREMGKPLRAITQELGSVVFRNGGRTNFTAWSVELSPNSKHL